MSTPGLIVICGPTATGKSALALALAQHLSTVIISADSRQIYQDFNIGTAKPTPAERGQVPHFLMDCYDPRHTVTVGDYQDQAQGIIAQYHAQGITPLLVGGTGLYIKSITHGLRIPRVSPQPDLRSALADLGQSHCYQLLQHLDPVAAARIHAHDVVRTLRGLEVYYVTGQPISRQQGEAPPSYPIWQICLTAERPTLEERVQRRTFTMWEQGFVAEVVGLRQKYGKDLPLLQTLGYAEVSRFLEGDITEAEAQALTVRHTLQFAKRQRTWFRGVHHLHWLNLEDGVGVDQVLAICR